MTRRLHLELAQLTLLGILGVQIGALLGSTRVSIMSVPAQLQLR
jgi:hypothetical protein